MAKLNALQQAMQMFKKSAQRLSFGVKQTPQPGQGFSQPFSGATPLDMRVLIKNLMDQTPYSFQGRQQISETPINSSYVPNADYGGNYSRGAVNINTSNLDPNNAVGILRHELGHSQDINSQGYNYSPQGFPKDYFRSPGVSNSYGIMNYLRAINPRAANVMEKRLADWGTIYNQPYSQNNQYNPIGNWKDTEAYATMAENPSRIMSPQLQQRFPQYIPYSKNINYSPVYPSAELLNRQ